MIPFRYGDGTAGGGVVKERAWLRCWIEGGLMSDRFGEEWESGSQMWSPRCAAGQGWWPTGHLGLWSTYQK